MDASEEDKDASNERIHSHHHHRRSLKVSLLWSFESSFLMLCMVFVTRGLHSHVSQNLLTSLETYSKAGEGYKTAAYTKPYSFFDSRMLIFLTHRGDHESRMNKPLLIDIHIH
ncbi:uncharacterized protein LOC111435236 isoform X1 [Cucurbita moschata]|uniref:Uncharacterized protein LOC111435236 isoform X1 n=1 Tax=Cucurbita moschata TaxID=3662 RepID=A0A6J1ERM0_CUCMO|nr:uncharacterized protein LOC111435236 isoform X1 [Cucurbita moschata]